MNNIMVLIHSNQSFNVMGGLEGILGMLYKVCRGQGGYQLLDCCVYNEG